MSEFIDLAGASGVVYRFQRVSDLGALPAIAGNFVYVRGESPDVTVVCAGTGETLLEAGKRWAEAVREHQAEAIFVRKNVSRRSREQEHRDIVEGRVPSMDASENFAGRDPAP
jgi:uncharacterized membrane protein